MWVKVIQSMANAVDDSLRGEARLNILLTTLSWVYDSPLSNKYVNLGVFKRERVTSRVRLFMFCKIYNYSLSNNNGVKIIHIFENLCSPQLNSIHYMPANLKIYRTFFWLSYSKSAESVLRYTTFIILAWQMTLAHHKQGNWVVYNAQPGVDSMPASMMQLYSACIQLQLSTTVFMILLLLQITHPPLKQSTDPIGVPLYPVESILLFFTMIEPTASFMHPALTFKT